MSKSKTLVYVEYGLLALCLSVLAVRTMFTEGPAMQSTTQAVNLGDNLYSLSISAILIFSLNVSPGKAKFGVTVLVVITCPT